jgi:hypothetical protein
MSGIGKFRLGELLKFGIQVGGGVTLARMPGLA